MSTRTINVGGMQGRGDPPLSRAAYPLRTWWLEFDCDGTPVVATVQAANESAAETLARHQLAHKHADFDKHVARLVACLER